MHRIHPWVARLTACIGILALGLGRESTSVAAEDMEMLKITIGEPTPLSRLRYQNTASLAVSRTGVLAAFYPKPGTTPAFYRTSTDGGLTWGPEMQSPSLLAGGSAAATLRDGGVLKFLTTDSTFKGEAQFHKSPMEGEYVDGWFTLHSTFAWFNDDFTKYEVGPVRVYMPDAVTTKQTHLAMSTWPIFADDKMIHLPNGDLLAAMQGVFKGDSKGRTILCTSADRGHRWRYYATVAYDPKDPNPDLPGQYLGYAEPSIALLPNGQMICAMRTQYTHLPGEYRPLHLSWSDDLGKTWTKPMPTDPHLMNICPELAVLNNGVVACEYGRPGFHVAFSLDNGHTWQDRISFSDLPEPVITGQFDMIKAGPNRLLAIGSDAEGTKVWAIGVERVKGSRAHATLEGRVLDRKGDPIVGAQVVRGPNRYTADDWLEDPVKTDPWGAGTPLTVGSPKLGYRSIRTENGHPTARTDAEGRFRFEAVKLGEYVLTVEADGHAPQHRHIKAGPRPNPQEFRLKPGRRVRSRVVDDAGRPVPGACVVLSRWHTHTDSDGFFHWSVAAPLPEHLEVRVYRNYSRSYETLKATVPFSEIERQPIVLRRKK